MNEQLPSLIYAKRSNKKPLKRVTCNSKLKILKDGECVCRFGPINKNKPNRCRRCPRNRIWDKNTQKCIKKDGEERIVQSVPQNTTSGSSDRSRVIQECMNLYSEQWCKDEYDKMN